MRVDFYQLAGTDLLAATVATLAAKVLASGGRLLVVHEEAAVRARLDRMLWEEGGATAFLPHGVAGTSDDARQPVLLSGTTDAPNLARTMLVADGTWRPAGHFDRTLFLFSDDKVEAAREAWRALAQRAEGERHYWAQEDGRWVRKG